VIDPAGQFRTWNRNRKAAWCDAFIAQHNIKRVLLVGTSGSSVDWENQVERAIREQCEVTVWSGITPPAEGLTDPYVQCDGTNLPFRDAAFDFVFSNAVVEHVGDAEQQTRFIAEHRRVGRWWAATTPNRWFPIESHTVQVFKHWNPRWRATRDEFTRLLSRRELRDLCAAGTAIDGSNFAPTFTAFGPGFKH
jgi:hypothetical protein